jgi:hypothetical protein
LPDTLAFDRPDDDGVDDKLPTNRSNADSGEDTQPPTPVNPANVSVCTTTAPIKLDDADANADGETSADSGNTGDKLWLRTLCAIVRVDDPDDHQDDEVPTTSAPKYTDESPAHTKR